MVIREGVWVSKKQYIKHDFFYWKIFKEFSIQYKSFGSCLLFRYHHRQTFDRRTTWGATTTCIWYVNLYFAVGIGEVGNGYGNCVTATCTAVLQLEGRCLTIASSGGCNTAAAYCYYIATTQSCSCGVQGKANVIVARISSRAIVVARHISQTRSS